jgi:spoIIIJ-associated protein
MSRNGKRKIEARGQNVEQAVANGLQRLQASRDDVEITVLDEGSRGLLGIGARDAVVSLTVKKKKAATPKPVEKPAKSAKRAPKAAKPAPKAKPQPAPVVEEKPIAEPESAPQEKEAPTAVSTPKPEAGESTPPDPKEEAMAKEVVGRLLQEMHIEATVESSLSEPDDLNGRQIYILDIKGEDLGVLVGPRGETLNALQYISRLMVGHQMQDRATFVVDVEGYRQRRQKALGRLAERMAEKVVKRGRAVSLEPMPAHERRIIHMTLRHNEAVYTESAGEGSRRKVRIIPK